MRLWPRLPLPRAQSIVRSYAGKTLDELAAVQWTLSAPILFAPTGGTPVDERTLRGLRETVEQFAREAGYPNVASRAGRATFDTLTTRFLADYFIPFGEALRPETWAWIATVLLPHVVLWRWADRDGVELKRFAGPLLRNAVGRLWYHSWALDRGKGDPDRWRYLDGLGADQLVALLERPSLGANRSVCLAVAQVWCDLEGRLRSELLFRETMKALIVRSAIQRFDVVEAAGLEFAIRETVATTARRLRLA